MDTLERRYHHADDGRQRRDQCQENRTDDRNSRHNLVQIVFGCLTRTDTRDKAAVCFHVVGNLIRVECDAGIEICEENNQHNIQYAVDPDTRIAGR